MSTNLSKIMETPTNAYAISNTFLTTKIFQSKPCHLLNNFLKSAYGDQMSKFLILNRKNNKQTPKLSYQWLNSKT